jgi:hypothetical protein
MNRLFVALAALGLIASPATAQIITGSVPNTFVNGTIIDATQVNADYTYIINQVNANGAKSGVNSDITALTALATPLTPAQSGSSVYYANAAASGTANAIVVASAIPANFTLAYGKSIRFISGAAGNTAATTLAVNGTTATNVYKQTPSGLTALTGGEIPANTLMEAFYDGVQFELMGQPAQSGVGPLTDLAGSGTPDLGTIGSHNINLTGGPFTITAFGSTANRAYPLYMVRYNAANTLVNSASLLLLNGTSRMTAASDVGWYQYNGAGAWAEVAFFPAQVKYGPTMANALFIRNNAGTPNTKVDITASEVVMDNTNGGAQYVENYGTCTIDLSVVGLNGLDAGAIAANTWYYIYAIGNGATTNVCLASTSATTPTMPGVYTYRARLGAIRTASGAATLWTFTQRGNTVDVTSADGTDHTAASGVAGTCPGTFPGTFVATSTVWGSLAPLTAGSVDTRVSVFNAAACVTSGSAGNNEVCAFSSSASLSARIPAKFNYTGTTTLLYCASAAAANLTVSGWTDAVNAN